MTKHEKELILSQKRYREKQEADRKIIQTVAHLLPNQVIERLVHFSRADKKVLDTYEGRISYLAIDKLLEESYADKLNLQQIPLDYINFEKIYLEREVFTNGQRFTEYFLVAESDYDAFGIAKIYFS